MTIQWSTDILDGLVAPGYTAFTGAEMPDLRPGFPQAPYWPANFFRNSMMATFESPTQAVALGFLRRAHHGFAAYHAAREATAIFVAAGRPDEARVTQFYAAVALWETFVLDMNMAMDLFKWFHSAGAFKQGDGSKEQRLYDCANQVKHHRGSASRSDASLVPLWLSNDGLLTVQERVSYIEASQVLSDVATFAERLQNPRTAASFG